MEPLSAIEQFTLVRLLKSSYFAYPVLNALHIASIGAVLTSVLLLDLSVLRVVKFPAEAVFQSFMRRVAVIAFAAAATTGLALFSVRATHYAVHPVFVTKLALIALAGLNLLLFAMLEARNGGATPTVGMRLSAGLSILVWIGVLLAGRLIGFW